MPFVDRSAATGARGGAADALAHDVITRLAKLRSLFVIAQGTVFALHERSIGAGRGRPDAERRLRRQRLRAAPGQAPDRDGRAGRDAHRPHRLGRDASTTSWTTRSSSSTRSATGSSPPSPARSRPCERNRAILKPPNSLDAWEAHHRGLWHMYRFNKPDNEQAQAFLRDGGAPRSDLRARLCRPVLHAFPERLPGLGEARAGDRPGLRGRRAKPDGRRSRSRPRTGPWAGRSGCAAARTSRIVELEQAIDLSPNFALGHYTLAFVHSQAGDPSAAIASVRSLAPAEPVRSAAVRACSARAPWRWCGSAGSRRPPTGASRPPPARTRMRISWRSPPIRWRWPVGSTRRAATWRISADVAALRDR